jgi:hypothetical protein
MKECGRTRRPGWPVCVIIAALAVAGCSARDAQYLGSMGKQNDELKRENLFLRRHLGKKALELLMHDLNSYRLKIMESVESRTEPSGEARLLARDIALIPGLFDSYPLDERQRLEIGSLTDDAAAAAGRLIEPGALADAKTARSRLGALQLSCTACHVQFGGPAALPSREAGEQ